MFLFYSVPISAYTITPIPFFHSYHTQVCSYRLSPVQRQKQVRLQWPQREMLSTIVPGPFLKLNSNAVKNYYIHTSYGSIQQSQSHISSYFVIDKIIFSKYYDSSLPARFFHNKLSHCLNVSLTRQSKTRVSQFLYTYANETRCDLNKSPRYKRLGISAQDSVVKSERSHYFPRALLPPHVV